MENLSIPLIATVPRGAAEQKACTLVEVLMAAVVLVVSFTAVIEAVTMGADMIDTARKQQIAQQIIDGEISYQRTLNWSATGSQLGINDMLNNPTFRIWVNADGSIGYDPVGSMNVPVYFALSSNTALVAMSKGFICQSQSLSVRPWFSPPMISVTYTLTWIGYLGRI